MTPGPLLLGVRHHGPGSARAVRAALQAARPRAVLIEGPPEADALLPLAADEAMRPPVALLAHVADDPRRAAFWPLAEFSPEWVAIRWALGHGVPVRFIDLPAAHSLALTEEGEEDRGGGEGVAESLVVDPVGVLAEAAGYDDPERWWEDVVEHRGDGAADPFAPFGALTEAMGALRETYGDGGHPRDRVREAHMRLRLRAARKEFGDDFAVVCGAWHLPALGEKVATATADRALLKGLPKVRAEMTWVPWTYRRLARRSGYGAGIESPGWYGHLFGAPDRPVERWMTKVAGLLRAEDRLVSSAHVIEAVRLAETLAVMRGRPLAGLTETMDAVRAVMCEGSDVPLALVHDRLVVGDVLGEVPDTAPAVPLQRDLTRTQRSLRLKPEAQERDVEFDLRKETDAARSRLLHRLRLLSIGWGEPAEARGSTGTFREAWRLRWEPELPVRVAEAGVWGTTVLSAATAKAETQAVSATALADVTALAEQCLLAELPDALPVVMRALADRAALDADVGHLAQALPALARSLRYGDVRGTDTVALGEVAAGLAERICVGLPPACTGLDADGTADMRRHLDAVHAAVGLLAGTAPGERRDVRGRWSAVLSRLAGRDSVGGVIRGRAARLLLDDGRLAEEDAARLMSLALSPGTPPADAAAWIEGFVGGASGGGMLLVHDERLLGLVDTWLTGVSADAFTGVLPLLRRTFSAYEPGVRRTLGELVRRGPSAAHPARTESGTPGFGPGLDEERADAVLPVLGLLLGDGTADAARPVGAGLVVGRASAGAVEGVELRRLPACPGAAAPPCGGAAHVAGRGGLGNTSEGSGERLRRWRLVLGGEAADGTGVSLGGQDAAMDGALGALYGSGRDAERSSGRSAGLGASAPSVARWLGDIRTYFPNSVVQVMQRDAIERLGLSALLLEPEMLEAVEADVHLVGTLLSLNKAMPETTRETARAVVRKVVADLEKRLATRTRATLTGALDRSARVSRPRHRDIDWDRTIRANLKNYLPEYRTVVPERLVGYGRASQSVKKDIVLCIDQSGSMAASVVYASVFGAVLASMRSVDTRLVVFDTAVVDLTDQLDDPVDVLFGTRLGGGTDINRALAYCQSRITRPADTVVVLISDLYEGGIRDEMLKRVAAMKASGVQFVALLALSDEGAPAYDREHAAALAALGAPAFACTPDLFPEVMAAAIEKRPLPIPDMATHQ
ncbi:VWA domain-containing protein [Streptomyces sp. ISL-99]|nr:VWA domain-containing protein [Streptomyces sp. ISL-99]